MAKRGRKPKAPALKLLEGNPGNRPVGGGGLVAEKGTPTCPAWLCKEGRAMWKRITGHLKQMDALYLVHRELIAAYADSWADYVAAKKAIDRDGTTTVTDKGNVVQNPNVAVKHRACERMVKLAGQLGITDVQRLAPAKTESVDEFEEFLQRKA